MITIGKVPSHVSAWQAVFKVVYNSAGGSFESASVYPDVLRRVTFLDVEKKKRFKFFTNNFTLPAHLKAAG